jgi:TATA-binding protein-associated factor Taf7
MLRRWQEWSRRVIHNPELRRIYKKVDQLLDKDQKALVVVPDSLVKQPRVRRVMTE